MIPDYTDFMKGDSLVVRGLLNYFHGVVETKVLWAQKRPNIEYNLRVEYLG